MEDYEYLWSTLGTAIPAGVFWSARALRWAHLHHLPGNGGGKRQRRRLYSAIYSALYLLGTNGHLSIIEAEAYFSDYLLPPTSTAEEGKRTGRK